MSWMVDSPLAHGPTLSADRGGDGRAQLEAGQTTGEYIVDHFVGAGAMGEVYAGHHPVIGKKVAIKVLRRDAASSDAAERFVREARAASAIDHPNVIDVFAFGRTADGRLYLVMDLVEGRTLREVGAGAPLPPERALAILEPIADALDAAHARGVIHRDLKPENIMLASEAPLRVRVLDFGLAKLVAAAGEGEPVPATLTGQGTWLGTPGYMAPEQWSVDGACAASDRYALGVIAFELLAGAPPFQAASVPAMMEQHFRAAVPALSARGRIELPSGVDDVLRRALAKDPSARFASARELVDALRAALAAKHTRAKRPWLPAAAAVGVLVVGAITIVEMRGRDRHAVHAVDPPSDAISIAISTSPEGGMLTVDGKPAGQAPATIAPRRGQSVELVARKPGYLPAHHTFVAGDDAIAVALQLVPVTRFEGVWRQSDGQLRALERGDDRVDISKLEAVSGPRTFFRHYAFVPADAGIAFAADDEVVDPRAPDEPSCHVPVHVEYRYDPARDALVLRREIVDLDFADGRCVVRARRIDARPATRADAARDTVEIRAPAGPPLKLGKQVKRVAPKPIAQPQPQLDLGNHDKNAPYEQQQQQPQQQQPGT
jgi:serine/threonine-protein kinase